MGRGKQLLSRFGLWLKIVQDRQSLCETLPYYRAFMGAAYHRDEEVRGILLGKDSAERAHLDTVVAITRA